LLSGEIKPPNLEFEVATHSENTLGLRLLVLQPTSFCNIDCSYCYLAHRQSKASMSLETLDLVCRRVFESSLPERRLQVAWHGGEPLVVSREWFDEAFALMEQRRPATLELCHRFQTNGLLVDDAWACFFARKAVRIGLSIDGPAGLHDFHRRTRLGRGTHAGAMRALHLLQDHAVRYHVLTVLTDRTLDAPDELFEFYVQNGIKEVGFNIEEIEGIHSTSSLASPEKEKKFKQFIKRFFDLTWQSPGLLKVRELESALGAILLNKPVVDEQNVPFAIVSVSADGKISSFSPELLDATHPRFRRFTFGNIATHSFYDVEQGSLFKVVMNEIRQGVQLCKHQCRYFRWCGGGAPANKLSELGRFNAAETMHCRLIRQAVFDEVLAGVEMRAGPIIPANATPTHKSKRLEGNHV
jgi:uncharacterized protein